MKKSVLQLMGFAVLIAVQPVLAANAVDKLLARYQAAGAGPANAVRGEVLWKQSHGKRDCTLCHGKDLTLPGKHARTGKRIDPMAPSVNSQRLTRERKIEKWFKRNCKWVIGRECTAQEKSDILAWLKQQ